jgi:hypothetical protein
VVISSPVDDAQERCELQGRLPTAREYAEAAPCGTSLIPLGCLRPRVSGVTVSAESGDVGSGDDIDVRDAWRHGLRSSFVGV